MIYVLLTRDFLRHWLIGHDLWRYVRVFTYVEFRAILSMLFSFLFVLVLGKRTIRFLLRMKFRDHPEFYLADLNERMKNKSQTPTMGGVLIVGAIVSAALLWADLYNFYVQMAILCVLWLAAIGMWDDWLKLTSAQRQQRSRDGLYFWEKLVFQLGLAVLLGLFIHHNGQYNSQSRELADMTHCLNLPLIRTWVSVADSWRPSPTLIVLGPWAFVLLSTVVIAGASNAVNLTDGMDGLAAGIMTIVAFAFMVLALIAGVAYGFEPHKVYWAKTLLVPYIPQSDELAILAGATVGACMGFLWFNCYPAQVFMGDTGSLPLGGLIGFIAVVTRQEFLLLIIGGVFVVEAVSVIIQVVYFKCTGGKRVFKCAPIHYHFHLSGWTEQQVVVRFWILSMVLAAFALATIKLR
jgi:phospho-N-acetylmuramoyl-pentapeptide-transferase